MNPEKSSKELCTFPIISLKKQPSVKGDRLRSSLRKALTSQNKNIMWLPSTSHSSVTSFWCLRIPCVIDGGGSVRGMARSEVFIPSPYNEKVSNWYTRYSFNRNFSKGSHVTLVLLLTWDSLPIITMTPCIKIWQISQVGKSRWEKSSWAQKPAPPSIPTLGHEKDPERRGKVKRAPPFANAQDQRTPSAASHHR